MRIGNRASLWMRSPRIHSLGIEERISCSECVEVGRASLKVAKIASVATKNADAIVRLIAVTSTSGCRQCNFNLSPKSR